MSEMNWNELNSVEQLEEIDALSANSPILIFKHSTRCSISAASLNRMERKWNPVRSQKVKPYFLDLIANREVSDAVASRYGVHHQSPQVLLIQKGHCIYDNSHFGISFEDLIDHIASATV